MQTIIAKHLLEKEAVKINHKEPFTWTSWIKSPIYCDNRVLISYSDAYKDIIQWFKKIAEKLDFDVIAWTATAWIPWSAMLAYEMNKPMIYIRKKAKEHWTKSQIEWKMNKWDKVLLIEDLISTWKSSLIAKNAIIKEWWKCDNILAIFSYWFAETKQRFEEEKCNFETLTNFETLLNEINLNKEEKENILKFSQNPKKWWK